MTGASADICEAQAASSAHIPLHVTEEHSKYQKTHRETGPAQGAPRGGCFQCQTTAPVADGLSSRGRGHPWDHLTPDSFGLVLTHFGGHLPCPGADHATARCTCSRLWSPPLEARRTPRGPAPTHVRHPRFPPVLARSPSPVPVSPHVPVSPVSCPSSLSTHLHLPPSIHPAPSCPHTLRVLSPWPGLGAASPDPSFLLIPGGSASGSSRGRWRWEEREAAPLTPVPGCCRVPWGPLPTGLWTQPPPPAAGTHHLQALGQEPMAGDAAWGAGVGQRETALGLAFSAVPAVVPVWLGTQRPEVAGAGGPHAARTRRGRRPPSSPCARAGTGRGGSWACTAGSWCPCSWCSSGSGTPCGRGTGACWAAGGGGVARPQPRPQPRPGGGGGGGGARPAGRTRLSRGEAAREDGLGPQDLCAFRFLVTQHLLRHSGWSLQASPTCRKVRAHGPAPRRWRPSLL